MTLAQCHALLEIAEAGETNIVDLSRRLGLNTSTLSRTVDSLVKADYENREANPGNRRYARLRLAGAGRSKVEFIDGAYDRFYLDLLCRIPKAKRPQLADSVKLLVSVLGGRAEAFSNSGGCCFPAPPRKKGNRHDRQQ